MLADAIRGTSVIVIIMIVAGAIAYVGDRVGHQVGRKRLTLLGMRPRYTSTIVAVGTGMVIALAVTLTALIFSQQVQTALFKMNQLSLQISTLQGREQDLESKVNNGQLVVPVGTLMVPYFSVIKKGTSVEDRIAQVNNFYKQAVGWMNSTYQPLGLKKFSAPADAEDQLKRTYSDPQMTSLLLSTDLLLVATADQNLYLNDSIHFGLQSIPDTRRLGKGQTIASLEIPSGRGADVTLAVNELRQIVSNIALGQSVGLAPFIANNVQVVQGLPSANDMQNMLKNGKGRFVMTAYAAEDIYPHTGFIPVVVTLTQTK
jgi:hypothetical protein